MDGLRRLVRNVLGWDSKIYRRAAETWNRVKVRLAETSDTARALRRLSETPAGAPAEPVAFRALAHPFHLRPGTKDVLVAINNFVRREYGAFDAKGAPKVMVDGGAYIGDTSAYFLSRFPGLRVIALEPMPESREQAQRNLAPYGDRVELREAALTADGAPVRMSGVQTGARIGDAGDLEVPSVSISQLLDEMPDARIDILKLDIEGAEGPIFADAPERWLDRVGTIIVETHGPEITDTVLGAMATNGWAARRYRNLYFCQKA